MHQLPRSSLALALCAFATGCASITTGQNQSLSVETLANGQAVAGASCRLENDKGTWFAISPGTVVVRRSYNDLNIRCEKDGHAPGVTAASSSTKGMAFGNIVFGGIIGAAVDAGSGAAYDYPSIITVMLGRNHIQAPVPTPSIAPQPAAEAAEAASDPMPLSANTRPVAARGSN